MARGPLSWPGTRRPASKTSMCKSKVWMPHPTVRRPALLDRLRVAGWRRAAFRVISALGAQWPARSGREALVLSENELLHETAFSLALRGWVLRNVRLSAKPADLDAAETSALTSVCREVMTPYCERWVVEPVREHLIALLSERLLSAARTQKTAAANFERLLAELPRRNERVMLANFPAKPVDPRRLACCAPARHSFVWISAQRFSRNLRYARRDVHD